MATKSGKTQEHAFKKIQKDMKDSNLGNPIFFYGEDQYLVRWAVDAIIERFVEPGLQQLNCSVLTRETASVDTIITQCETLPMLSEKRIVIVERFPAAKENARENYTEEQEQQLMDYFKELPDSCFLILTADAVDKRKKLYKTIASSGCCYDFSRLDEGELQKFIQKRLRQSGKTASTSVIRQMIAMSGYFDKQSDYTLYNLDNDLKKLIAHSDGDEVRMSDVAGGLSGNTESYVFDMMDAISRNRKDEALMLLHNLLSSGENLHKLLGLICSHYEILLMVKEMREEGLRPEEMKALTGAHEYRIKIAGQLSVRYSIDQLRRILSHCFTVDKHIKTGLLEGRLALEMLIAGI